jgi:hypothetical protein
MPIAIPTIEKLIILTLPRYSGARNKEAAPKAFMKLPFTVLNKINQNRRRTWYFLKCRKSNWMGSENTNPRNQAFI